MFVATTVVGALLTPHQQGPSPSALGDFSVPTAQEGRAIPVILGTVKLQGGNTVWWGDLKINPIKPSLLATIFSFGAAQDLGFEYYLGVQFALCQGPVDALLSIQADKKDVPYTTTLVPNGAGSENYSALAVNAAKLFGGTTAGGAGGLSGEIDFYRGIPSQQPSDYLTAKQGRVALDQLGIGYVLSGVGNGTMTALSGGSASKNETLTFTAVGIDGNSGHTTYQKMQFSVRGSTSGTITATEPNGDGSHACWADQAFSAPQVNVTIDTGSTQFAPGDKFIVQTQHSSSAPAYPSICYAVFRQLYVGTSNYLKPLAFIVRRCPDPFGQGPSIANINGDANPALGIYDLLTAVNYGLGIPPTLIDAANFQAVAVVLAGEGLGISMQFDTQGSADQLIGEILRHADGVLYADPSTGLWTIKLARADYDASTLPALDVDSIIGTPDFSRSSWIETTNEVAVKFCSRLDDFNDRIIIAYDRANISVTNEVRPQTIEFRGISQEATAALVGMRVLKTLTYPLAKAKIVCDRSAWKYRPGAVFKFNWAPLDISGLVLRVTRIGYGELLDGKITIDCVEDIFGINDTAFNAAPPSGWVNPLTGPAAPAAQELMELPYHFSQAGRFVLALCARGDQTSQSFEVWVNEGSGDFEGNVITGFCPIGLLEADYPAMTPALDSAGFTLGLAGQVDLDELATVTGSEVFTGSILVLIDQEIMSVQTVTPNDDGSVSFSGILRGVCDTVPADHAAGARAWFISTGTGTTKNVPYTVDQTVEAKLLPSNPFGDYPIASASYDTIATSSRAARPYPPGDLCIQGEAYADRPPIFVNDLILTWKSRNRLTQTAAGTLVAQDAGDITPEAGTTYTARIYIDGALIRTVADLSSETYTYPATQRILDDPDGRKTVEVTISAAVGALESFQAQSTGPVLFSGFGEDFGFIFGGEGPGISPPVPPPPPAPGLPGDHFWTALGPSGADPGTIGGRTAGLATDLPNGFDTDSTTYVDFEADHCFGILPPGTAASAGVVASDAGNGPVSVTSITVYVDCEVIENDLNSTQPVPAILISAGTSSVRHTLLTANAGDGVVGRTTYSVVIDPTTSVTAIQLFLQVAAYSTHTSGAAVLRLYGAKITIV